MTLYIYHFKHVYEHICMILVVELVGQRAHTF